jgi:ribonuclease HI
MLYECYVDGASRGQGTGQTGHGSAAVLIYRNRKLIGQYARALGRRDNNEAEYEAILLALMMCWAADLKDPIIYSDSNLVVKQINGDWKCNNEDLRPLLLSIQEIQDVFRFRVCHVPRKQVAEADLLANKILDQLLGPKPKNTKDRG